MPFRRSHSTPAATPATAKTAPPSARIPVPCAIPNPAASPTATRTADGKRVRASIGVVMPPILPRRARDRLRRLGVGPARVIGPRRHCAGGALVVLAHGMGSWLTVDREPGPRMIR